MRKIPTLFKRDPENMARVLPEVHPDCQWVLDGEGMATVKYDGTCVLYHDYQWWARREVKPGKNAPPDYVAEETDPNTGKTVGWEPMEQSAFVKWFQQAIAAHEAMDGGPFDPGSYELCGPKINGNPEHFLEHNLLLHADAEPLPEAPRSFDELRRYLTTGFTNEGIVWHHPDGRMAKLKRKDFA